MVTLWRTPPTPYVFIGHPAQSTTLLQDMPLVPVMLYDRYFPKTCRLQATLQGTQTPTVPGCLFHELSECCHCRSRPCICWQRQQADDCLQEVEELSVVHIHLWGTASPQATFAQHQHGYGHCHCRKLPSLHAPPELLAPLVLLMGHPVSCVDMQEAAEYSVHGTHHR